MCIYNIYNKFTSSKVSQIIELKLHMYLEVAGRCKSLLHNILTGSGFKKQSNN